jgi:hypothetical protein
MRSRILFMLVGLLLMVGCGEVAETQLPTPINREAVVELYIAALEDKDSHAILALHHPNNLPSLTALSNKLDSIGGQPIEIIELTFINEFGEDVTSVRMKGKLGISSRAQSEFLEQFALSREQNGRWYLSIGEE